jgi:hypothetical protein
MPQDLHQFEWCKGRSLIMDFYAPLFFIIQKGESGVVERQDCWNYRCGFWNWKRYRIGCRRVSMAAADVDQNLAKNVVAEIIA